MKRTLRPATGISGAVTLPGDKSISHRYAMLASLAEGCSVIDNYSTGADCISTLECLRSLHVDLERKGTQVTVHGQGLYGLLQSDQPLDVGNSGTTMRLMSGILAGHSFESTLSGDESISKRPMQRIMAPLRIMGAQIDAIEDQYPPLHISGGRLRSICYELPVASAQVKSAVLLAGMYADGVTEVIEPFATRNHTEIVLKQLGTDLEVSGNSITIHGFPKLAARDLRVPADLSSAVFFIAAALLFPGSELRIENVGLNPTRTAVLDLLQQMGALIEVHPDSDDGGELAGTLVIRTEQKLAGGKISGDLTAGVIDEIPMLAVLGAASEGGLRIRDAGELRVKETDRIATVVENLRRLGVQVTEHAEGMDIEGGASFQAAEFDSFGDHRIAMAFTVAALAADGESILDGSQAASVSFPEFYEKLEAIVQE